MWTVVLMAGVIGSRLLIPRIWWGWFVEIASTILWLAYATVRHDHALFLTCLTIYLPFDILATRTAYRKAH